ncbi:unnamed protein product [Caenorhabditis sp. 36 PRJEB53466]|nr:unnamed protein product [Caenorhabditis sp. 36 PRJEB53466]
MKLAGKDGATGGRLGLGHMSGAPSRHVATLATAAHDAADRQDDPSISHGEGYPEIQTIGVCAMTVFVSGRACSFIGALIAINQLNKGIEPNICEIITNIKQQRPGATESFAPYAGIYAIVLDYISRKRGNKSNPNNKNFIQKVFGNDS